MFSPQAIIEVAPAPDAVEDASMMAIEAGASDLDLDNGVLTVIADPAVASAVTEALRPFGEPLTEIQLTASTNVTLESGQESTLVKLLESLDNHDDVQRVSTNAVLQTL
jgi:transcriptional/translational regulatory protein YebC/TACO1